MVFPSSRYRGSSVKSAGRKDRRSPEAEAYRKLYKLSRWKAARAAQLAKQPLCERCLKRGDIVAAGVVNHRTPHKGDWELFVSPDNHESCCKRCHDGDIQSEERLGYSNEVGADGYPIDPAHHWTASEA